MKWEVKYKLEKQCHLICENATGGWFDIAMEAAEFGYNLATEPKVEGVEKDLHYAKLDIEAKDERIAELESSLKLMNSIYNEDLAIKKELEKEMERLTGATLDLIRENENLETENERLRGLVEDYYKIKQQRDELLYMQPFTAFGASEYLKKWDNKDIIGSSPYDGFSPTIQSKQ